jgi:hypothetical protein
VRDASRAVDVVIVVDNIVVVVVAAVVLSENIDLAKKRE